MTRAALTGLLATLADLALLQLLVSGLGLDPRAANLPALLAGAVVQFLGCRNFVFRTREGALIHQLAGFSLVETATFALNAAGFHLLVPLMVDLGLSQPHLVTRVGVSFAVFALFSFPAWKRVFSTAGKASRDLEYCP